VENRNWPNFGGKGWFHLDALTVNSELTIKTNSRDKKLELILTGQSEYLRLAVNIKNIAFSKHIFS